MKNEMRNLLLGAIALVAAVWAVWAQTGGFEYIRLDDSLYTWDFPPVAQGLSWAGVRAVFSDFTQGGIWMPLTSLTYMLDISLFGAGPGPHHLVSVGWHSVNAVLVFLLLWRLTGRRSVFAACAAAAFWALHAQRCESVAWIASRKDLVFMFWTLLGLFAWIRFDALGTVLGWVFMALGCLSKPTAMVFPAVAFCAEWALLGRRIMERPFRRVLKYLPLLVLTVATAAVAVYSQTHATGEAVRGLSEGYGSFAWRCLNAAVAIGLYLAQSVVPWGIHIIYRPHVGAMPDGMAIGLIVLMASLAALVWALVRRRGSAVFWAGALWFIAALSPTLGVAGGFGDHARADRFLYLPMVGASLIVAYGLSCVLKDRASAQGMSRHAPFLVRAVVTLVVVINAVVAWCNTASYENSYTLFSRVCAFDPDHPMALQHVATETCARLGRPDDGIALFYRVLELDPTNEDATGQLAFALARRGRFEDAPEVRRLCQPLLAHPEKDDNGMATEALGMVAMRERRWNDAIRFFSASLNAEGRKHPGDEAAIQLAMCLYNRGDLDEAAGVFGQLAQNSADARIKARATQALQVIWQKQQRRDTK